MTTIGGEPSQAEAVQDLFDGLMRFSRSLRSRSGDWAHATGDLTRGDIVMLGVVARAEGTRCGQIAASLGVDPSVVSRQLATLDRLELIARGTDPHDRRAELISITPQGRERLREARDAICETLAARLSGWDTETIVRAAAVVDDLAGLLHEPTPDSLPTEPSKDAHV